MNFIRPVWNLFNAWPYCILVMPIVVLSVYFFFCFRQKYKLTEEAMVELVAYASAISWSFDMIKTVFKMHKEEEKVILTTFIGAVVLGYVAIKGIFKVFNRFKIVDAKKVFYNSN